MSAFIIYLAKSAVVLLLFYSCYYFFLRKETLFGANRWFLICGILVSMLLPFAYYTKTVYITGASIANGTQMPLGNVNQYEGFVSWSTILLSVYVLGCVCFTIKLLLELYSVRNFIKVGKKEMIHGFICIQSSKNIQPFSFFQYIVYNPSNHSPKDLEFILAHEQVHARQRHSIDIVLMEILLILQWFNPTAWLYKRVVKQNLEFLADTQNKAVETDKKQYQYLLLKQSIGKHRLSIINPFFNSLIKKRIVMINQIPSQKIKAIKTLLIIPFLALFFLSFNARTEYQIGTKSEIGVLGKSIELIIDKNTTNEELETMKSDLKKDGIDFSYTVVHNESKEIIDISIQISGKGENGGTFNNMYNSSDNDTTISPLIIFIDPEHNLVSIGSKGSYSPNSFHFDADDSQIWISSGGNKHKEIRIKEENGKKTVYINGEEVDEKDLKEMDIHLKSSSKVFIHSDSDDEHDIKVIGDKGNGFFFIDTDGKDKPLFYIDGKKASSKEVEALSPDQIETMKVVKGDKAQEKYGKKAKNGVIEITTKEN